MKRNRLKVYSLLASAMALSPLAIQAVEYIQHTVKSGDSLSKILHELHLKPLYGRDGSIAKTVELNAGLKKSKGNFLLPGQQIFVPIEASLSPVKVATAPAPEVEEKVEPVLARVPSEDVTEKARSILSAGVGVDFFKIKGVDSVTKDKAIILSEASPSLLLGYHLLWNEATTLSLEAKVQNYQFEKLNDGQTFKDDKGNRVGVGLKLTRAFTERFDFGAGVSFEQDLFIKSESPTELSVDKVLITKPNLHARYKAFEKSNASIGVDGRVGMNLSSETNSYNIKSGTHAGAGAYFNYHTNIFAPDYKSLEARVFYSVDNQDTSITTRKFTNLSFMLVYDWRLPW